MSRKAVDVVLLPVEAMTDRAIEVNAELVARFGEKIVLNKENCLPHVSLAMGCVDEGDIADVEKVLARIAKERPLSDLTVTGIMVGTNAKGEKVSAFEVERTEELQSLHKEVMEGLAGYLSSDVTSDMVYDWPDVAESSLQWIKGYREKSSFANFRPHITIGYGETDGGSFLFPIRFSVSGLALCRLGNHCTCREVLVFIELC